MKIESQVCSLENAKQLKELGIKQESLFYYLAGGLCSRSECLPLMGENWYSAYTAAELGEILPADCTSSKLTGGASGTKKIGWCCRYYEDDYMSIKFIADTEADARADCLIFLSEKDDNNGN